MINIPIITLYILLGAVMVYGAIFMIRFRWFWEQSNSIIFVTGIVSASITAVTIIIVSFLFVINNVRWV